MTNGTMVPEPWYSALLNAGFTGPHGDPSLRQLALAVDIHPSTVSRIIHGTNTRGARPEYLGRIAKALRTDPAKVAEWAKSEWREGPGPYTPPAGTEILALRQRETVDRVIRAFIEVNQRARTRRALDSKTVVELAKATRRSRREIADILEEIEGAEIHEMQ
ncbi:helix-turn-helix domain-containing protein [Gordonia sputi]|nr:helix-turn-helix transcriptional regulator [Gordonia sputi]NKY95590.1 helix-turn-helix transcriptional regulator [Gordonia sputi]